MQVTGFLGMWLDHYPDPSDPDDESPSTPTTTPPPTGAEVGDPDPAETSEVRWFAPDELPPVAFPAHANAVLAAWRDALKDGRTVTPLPDRPWPPVG